MPDSMKGGWQCTPDTDFQNDWHWIKTQKMLAVVAYEGIILGMSIAFCILLMATQNIITSVLATFTIFCSTVCVIGIIPLCGWNMGVLESGNMTIVVGLCVDYTAHLARGYTVSKKQDRQGRTKDMLTAIGQSIVNGAITTILASVFMIPAKISFLRAFGIFMVSTVLSSFFFSMGFFTIMMGLVGPQGTFGSLNPLFTRVYNWWYGRKKDDVDCSNCDGRGYHGHSLDNNNDLQNNGTSVQRY